MMKKIILSALTLVIAFQFAFAVEEPIENDGSGIITGRVVDESDIPLPGVTIRILDLDKGTITDADGYFRLSGLPRDRNDFVLIISYVGYKTITMNVTLRQDRTTNVFIKFENNITLDEIVVKGTAGGTLRAINQQKNIAMSLNMTVGGIAAHQSAMRDGEWVKVPQFSL